MTRRRSPVMSQLHLMLQQCHQCTGTSASLVDPSHPCCPVAPVDLRGPFVLEDMCAGLLLSDTSELQVRNRRVGHTGNTSTISRGHIGFPVDPGTNHLSLFRGAIAIHGNQNQTLCVNIGGYTCFFGPSWVLITTTLAHPVNTFTDTTVPD